MFLFLTVVQAIVALLLVGVILMQKSEGGGLGVGGSPSGIMSARGAANFLTRATGILAAVFVILSIVLAALAVNETTGRDIDTSLQRETAPAAPAQPADPLAGPAAPAGAPADGASPAPAGAAPAGTTPANDPLSGAAGR
ncbi:preprotein translocase subunit SecG [Novosphingobium sp. ST904]|uniref:preprotein translocase subunit SecG n=1 Tax=Novosphingobium sp. ST904 TaxID=1684385 RepID=UPI0006C833CC|nr:preprotein translocase subunit SecG [Novosphingobium sp. ST904]KPH63332.1 preprotein translocase subunit SecG [Novosphingobium sp. ST904]TCM40843.1 preprotein translocase subunit SecG [Novosphingobium sp. ST904]